MDLYFATTCLCLNKRSGAASQLIPGLDLWDGIHSVHPGGDERIRLQAVGRHMISHTLGPVAKLCQDLKIRDRGLVAAKEGTSGVCLLCW